MEILNNIWTALTTQNEELTKVLTFLCSFIEAYILLSLFCNILNVKRNKKQTYIYVIVSVTCSFITRNYIPAPYNNFLNYIILYTMVYFTFKLSILKTLLALLIPMAIFALIYTLVFNPFVKLMNIDYYMTQYIPIYRLLYLAISFLFATILIFIFKYKNIKINILEEIDKKTKTIIFINILLGFIVLIIQLVISVFYTNRLPVIITLLSFISLLAYFSISVYSLTRVNKLYITNKKLENAEEYNKTLQILHDNIRTFKHDYDNTVAAIGGYVKTKDLSGLEQYYSQLEDECVKVNRLYMLNPNIINNPGIYSILTTKYNEAEELNIKMNITVLWDLSKINMKIYEFTKIFGILIDNAIDAAKESDEKIINVLFKDDEKNKMQYLKIENSYAEKDVDLDNIFEKGKTSKENHTGLGLWEIRKILKRNNNLNLHTTKDSKYFTQQFEIYN